MTRTPAAILWTLLLALLPAGLAGQATSEAPADSVRLQLKWLHQFQGAGFYQAVAQGFYREAGLHVTLIENVPDQDPANVVLAGEAEFGVATSGLLRHRAAGEPVVALAAILQHSPYVVVARTGNDLRSIHDLVGKRLLIEGSAEELLAYLALEQVPLAAIDVGPHEGSVDALLEGRADAITAYTSTEPYFLDQANFEYQVLDPRASGIDYYGDVLFTTEGLLEENEPLARAFVQASMAGWRYAMDHVDETIELILSDYAPELDRAQMEFEAREIERLMIPELVPPGHMYEGRWRRIAEGYVEADLLPEAFTLEGFLLEAEEGPELTRFYLILLGVALFALVVSGVLLRFHLLNLRLREEMAERRRAEGELREASVILRGELESQERGLEVLARELAERKRELQQSLELVEVARARAEEASRAKSRFLAAMSHELRAPLTAIIGHTDLLADREVPDRGDDGRHLDEVRVAARRLAVLVDEILALVGGAERQTVRERAPVCLVSLARSVVDGHRESAFAKGLDLTLQAPPGELTILSDPARVHEALSQLVQNAIRFTSGGSVGVRIEREEAGVRIEVEDTGPGIPPDEVDRIFEPFTQLEDPQTRRVGGAGIGLALARGFARALGGEVRVSRAGPSGGSVFTLHLPEPSQPSAPRRVTSGRTLEGASILVVDDDASVRRVMARALRRHDATVDEARDVEDALGHLEQASYDLLLSDVSMPGRTGISLAEETSARWPGLPVVLVSGAELTDEERRSAQGVAHSFIRKPFAVDLLIGTVRETLATPPRPVARDEPGTPRG